MRDAGTSGPTLLASTTVCEIEDRGDGHVDVRMGVVTLRLSRRELASLAGTFHRVVKGLYPRRTTSSPVGRATLRLVHDAARPGLDAST